MTGLTTSVFLKIIMSMNDFTLQMWRGRLFGRFYGSVNGEVKVEGCVGEGSVFSCINWIMPQFHLISL